MSTITFHYHSFSVRLILIFPEGAPLLPREGCCAIARELPRYVYYSYAHNVVMIAYRHLFANLFLSFRKTHSRESK